MLDHFVIRSLSEYCYFKGEVAELVLKEFREANSVSGIENFEDSLNFTNAHLDRHFIVLDTLNEDLAATCCIIDKDIEYGKYTDTGPWLANLIVKRQYRGQGIGQELIDFVIRKLKHEKSFPRLYLWTEDENLTHYYERNGFKFLDTQVYLNSIIYIMQIDLVGENHLIA